MVPGGMVQSYLTEAEDERPSPTRFYVRLREMATKPISTVLWRRGDSSLANKRYYGGCCLLFGSKHWRWSGALLCWSRDLSAYMVFQVWYVIIS